MLITESVISKSDLKRKFFFIILFVFNLSNYYSQIYITKPALPFTEACPSSTFNTFSLSFSVSPISSLNANNVYNIELSDATGDFTTPTLLTTSNATTSSVSVSFAMPITVSGANYKIRIKSTSPVSTSPNSDAFAANYAVFNMPFSINNDNSNQSFCENSGYELSVDEGANSPLAFPQLTYKWYKNLNLISGESSSTLNVTSEGNYYAQVNYGTCNNNAYSNAVSMFAIPTPELEIATETGETVFCEGEWLTLITSNISPTNVYQWYLNDVAIPNATNSSHIATEAGEYYLKIETTNCDLISNSLTITTIDTSSFTTDKDSEIELIPGENVIITASGADSYEWFVDDAVVGTTNTYTTNKEETIQLTGTIGNCSVIKNFIVTLRETPITEVIPTIISPNNDGINDTWVLPEEYIEKDNVEVVLFTAGNEVVFKTKNYSNETSLEGKVANNTVYYYNILKNNSIVAKGTLSILTK
jgi:CHU_C Type IX secretion signal domain